MRLWSFVALALGLSCGLGLLLGPAPAADQPGAVQIGLVKSLFRDTPPSLVQVISRPLKALMETQTGYSGDLRVIGNADQLAGMLDDGKMALGVLHGFEFAWVRQKHPQLKPLVIAVAADRVLHACLVVKRDNPATGPADLKGKKLAIPLRTREHCYLFLERRCCGGEAEPRKFFSGLSCPIDPEDALGDVIDGIADGALVEKSVLDAYRKRRPTRVAQIRVLLQSEPFPSGALVYKEGALPDEVLQRFKTGLITANQNPKGRDILNICRLDGFQAIPEDYEKLLADIAKAYPPPGDK